MQITTLVSVAAAAIAVSAKTINIEVGPDGLVFEPNSTTAAVGDVVSFTFYKGNHSVVQGDYNEPCQTGNLSMPFYSGFFPVSTGTSDTTFNVAINDTNPIYYYCSQYSHCKRGMVGVINPPSDSSLEAYAAEASNVNVEMENPLAPAGGTFQSTTNPTGAASTSASTSTSTSGTSSATATSSSTPEQFPGSAVESANTGKALIMAVAALGALIFVMPLM